MNIRTIKNEAKSRLSGHYSEAWGAIFAVFSTILLFVLINAFSSAFLLYFGRLSERELFAFSNNAAWTYFKLFYRVCFFFCVGPLFLSSVMWFERCARGAKSDPSCFSRLNSFPLCKGMFLLFSVWLLKLLLLLLPSACFYAAFRLTADGLSKFTSNTDAFMLTVCLAVLGICLLFYYLYVVLGLILCPFIFIRNGKKRIIGIIIDSFRLMKGKRRYLLKLMFSFIIYLPFLIFSFPHFFMSVSVFADNIISTKYPEPPL